MSLVSMHMLGMSNQVYTQQRRLQFVAMMARLSCLVIVALIATLSSIGHMIGGHLILHLYCQCFWYHWSDIFVNTLRHTPHDCMAPKFEVVATASTSSFFRSP